MFEPPIDCNHRHKITKCLQQKFTPRRNLNKYRLLRQHNIVQFRLHGSNGVRFYSPTCSLSFYRTTLTSSNDVINMNSSCLGPPCSCSFIPACQDSIASAVRVILAYHRRWVLRRLWLETRSPSWIVFARLTCGHPVIQDLTHSPPNCL